MAFDKYLKKAKDLANDPKVREKLNSEKAERMSDSFLDKAAGAADSLTKGKHSDKIRRARDAADNAIGTEGNDRRGSDGESGRGDSGSGDSGSEDRDGRQ